MQKANNLRNHENQTQHKEDYMNSGRRMAVFAVCLLALVASCSPRFSRTAAKRLIMEREAKSLLEQQLDRYMQSEMARSSDMALLSRLQTAGFAELRGQDNLFFEYRKFLFTDKARPYIHQVDKIGTYWRVKIGTFSDLEITGIREDTSSLRTVECVLLYQTTPVGKAFENGASVVRKDAKYVFERYEDGWRLQK
jgi:hypothetical protein